MKIQIDQSGKIEETHRETILAYSNSKIFSVKITAKSKRKLQELFREIGEPRSYVIAVFTVGIFLLIEDDLQNIDSIIIDPEYRGKEQIILKILNSLFEAHKIKEMPIIQFKSIGRLSKAHLVAIEVFRKKRPVNKILKFEDFTKTIISYHKRRPVLRLRLFSS